MDKSQIQVLAHFCVEQNEHFNPHDWLQFGEVDEQTVALVAKYLSMTSWYGHEDDLAAIADRLYDFTDDSAALYCESRMMGFDLPYFSSAVRFGIARLHEQAAVEAGEHGLQAMPHWTGRMRRRSDGMVNG